MISFLNDLKSLPLQFDVVIVGSGPAGVTLAMELAPTGLKIGLFESGGVEYDPEVQSLYDGVVTGLQETDLVASRLRYLGGTSNHWGGHCLPLDDIDFERAPLNGLSGWPFYKRELDPYYQRAHEYCDLGDYDYSIDTIAKALTEPFLEAPENIETKVIRQSSPTRFGSKYRDDIEKLTNVQLVLGANLVAMQHTEGRITAFTFRGLNGEKCDVTAANFILATGAIENARQLMWLNASEGTQYGNTSGLLGKCYMDHTVGGAGFFWLPTPVIPMANWQHNLRANDNTPVHIVWKLSNEILKREKLQNTQFFLIPLPEQAPDPRLAESKHGMSALKRIAKWMLGRDQHGFELSDEFSKFITNADSMALDLAGLIEDERITRRVLLRYEAEQRPDKSSYVYLSDNKDRFGMPVANLHWSPTEDDRDSIVRSTIEIGRLVGADGLGSVKLEDHFDARYWDAKTAWHQMGTTRMSLAPSDGVVDADLKVHGLQNLYVAGGSVMPTGGRANPTLTIVALSVRLANTLKNSFSNFGR